MFEHTEGGRDPNPLTYEQLPPGVILERGGALQPRHRDTLRSPL